MDRVEFTVSGVLRGKQRPKAGKRKGTGFVVFYTPEETVNQEAHIRAAVLGQIGRRLQWEGAVRVKVKVLVAIPKSFPAWKRKLIRLGMFFPLTKPDVDNGAKVVLDALNGVVWLDDKQVTDLCIKKRYGEWPETHVELVHVHQYLRAPKKP